MQDRRNMAAAPQRPDRRGPAKWVWLIAAVLVSVSLMPDIAFAASRVCRQLEAELASGGTASSSRSRRNDAAIAKQREQLQLTKSHARSAGCGFRLFKSGSGTCTTFDRKIDRMEQNLLALERKSGGSAKAGRSRAKIMAALRANGCRDDAVAERRTPRALEGPRNLIDHIFGGGIRQRGSLDELGPAAGRGQEQTARRVARQPEGGWVNEDGRIRFSAPPGRYRTLCVRTCDGYYFPVSNASAPSDFERDQANCQSSCPGTDVQIYYHRQGQESETMVSGLSGRPYSDLPAAWLYKQPDVPNPAGCGCGIPRRNEAAGYSVIAGNAPVPDQAIEPVTPQPGEQPGPGLDAETQAHPDRGMDAEALGGIAVAPKVGKPGPAAEQRRIRVVGPVFLPDPEGAADPQAQGRTEVQ
ncbi:MAG: DUF2865 domain-containing protein [Rhizobiaceae bacterium]|nr:DUF2865 domain-containing protein [Rhizobiaceae bacterium]